MTRYKPRSTSRGQGSMLWLIPTQLSAQTSDFYCCSLGQSQATRVSPRGGTQCLLKCRLSLAISGPFRKFGSRRSCSIRCSQCWSEISRE